MLGFSQVLSGTVYLNNSSTKASKAIVYLKDINKQIYTDENGYYKFDNLPKGNYTLISFHFGYEKSIVTIQIASNPIQQDFILKPSEVNLKEIVVDLKEESNGSTRLRDVEGTSIFAAKKNDVLVLKDITSNKATNNSRQLFSHVAGLNIWESDGAGLQLGIAARGLNPNRTSGFNTRFNGYDMSADAIGYPESYYTPPAEALERIQVIRGAASLQYGTQFGGMINFIPQKGPKDKKMQVTSRQTVGSFQFLNSFNSIGGTIKKLNYYIYFQHKEGNGWRKNSQFYQNALFANLNYAVNKRFNVGLDITTMKYLAQQPGGLTDKMFEEDPRQSIRSRNWFKVGWNLASLNFNYEITEKTKINSIFYGLIASRDALGNLNPINRADAFEERDLLKDLYKNFGNETRFLTKYKWRNNQNSFLVGLRYYQGYLDRKQGFGSNKSDADFNYYNFENTSSSEFIFPSRNFALFSEHIFQISKNFSITPGVRFEYITTMAEGSFTNLYYDNAGNVIEKSTRTIDDQKTRTFPLFGVGMGYNLSEKVELYANYSQNYRAITFNDMRVTNPSLRVDTLIKDENGYNMDLGIRGKIKKTWNFDITLFYLSYNDRIGIVQKIDTKFFTIYRLRTNISDSKTYGIESFIDCSLMNLFKVDSAKFDLNVFLNASLLDAKYINSQESAFQNRKVEFVPTSIIKSGIRFKKSKFASNLNIAYTSSQFTDATNALFTANAINGLIPSYWVADFSSQYTYKKITLEFSVNNFTNNLYFTRRADGYPGPGIIPSDGRAYYLTLQIQL